MGYHLRRSSRLGLSLMCQKPSIDTACGFAAGTVAGPNLLAANFSVNCLRPAVGQKFIARARVVKPGKAQVFTSCDLFAVDAEGEKLVVNGETLLTVIAA